MQWAILTQSTHIKGISTDTILHRFLCSPWSCSSECTWWWYIQWGRNTEHPEPPNSTKFCLHQLPLRCCQRQCMGSTRPEDLCVVDMSIVIPPFTQRSLTSFLTHITNIITVGTWPYHIITGFILIDQESKVKQFSNALSSLEKRREALPLSSENHKYENDKLHVPLKLTLKPLHQAN